MMQSIVSIVEQNSESNLPEPLKIIPLESTHWDEVKEIYQEGIETGEATFETNSPSWKEWDNSHHSFCRFVILDSNKVAGWAALLPVSKREVYRGVAEVSIYIGKKYRGKGIGKILLSHLISESESQNIWTLQATLFRENEASYKLHENLGFREIGFREKPAKLHGRWRDTVTLERRSKVVGIE